MVRLPTECFWFWWTVAWVTSKYSLLLRLVDHVSRDWKNSNRIGIEAPIDPKEPMHLTKCQCHYSKHRFTALCFICHSLPQLIWTTVVSFCSQIHNDTTTACITLPTVVTYPFLPVNLIQSHKTQRRYINSCTSIGASNLKILERVVSHRCL